jgi:hypothetical protein
MRERAGFPLPLPRRLRSNIRKGRQEVVDDAT